MLTYIEGCRIFAYNMVRKKFYTLMYSRTFGVKQQEKVVTMRAQDLDFEKNMVEIFIDLWCTYSGKTYETTHPVNSHHDFGDTGIIL